MTNVDLTLDPDDWDAFRGLAQRMVDESIAHVASLHEQPAWRPFLFASVTGAIISPEA